MCSSSDEETSCGGGGGGNSFIVECSGSVGDGTVSQVAGVVSNFVSINPECLGVTLSSGDMDSKLGESLRLGSFGSRLLNQAPDFFKNFEQKKIKSKLVRLVKLTNPTSLYSAHILQRQINCLGLAMLSVSMLHVGHTFYDRLKSIKTLNLTSETNMSVTFRQSVHILGVFSNMPNTQLHMRQFVLPLPCGRFNEFQRS